MALRYDPILINKEYSVEKHVEMFDLFAKSLKGYTEDVTISFLDLYEKVKRNAPNIRPPNSNSIPIIMGANIGTTINSQILRLANVEESSWLTLIFPATIAPVPLIY